MDAFARNKTEECASGGSASNKVRFKVARTNMVTRVFYEQYTSF